MPFRENVRMKSKREELTGLLPQLHKANMFLAFLQETPDRVPENRSFVDLIRTNLRSDIAAISYLRENPTQTMDDKDIDFCIGEVRKGLELISGALESESAEVRASIQEKARQHGLLVAHYVTLNILRRLAALGESHETIARELLTILGRCFTCDLLFSEGNALLRKAPWQKRFPLPSLSPSDLDQWLRVHFGG